MSRFAEKDAGVRVDQTIFVDDPKRKGNCVAACVATILGVPLERVPHFIEFGIAYGDSEDVKSVSSGNNWWAMMLGFLAGRGLWVVELDEVADADPNEYVLVAGMSPRGVVHQVVYREGRLWHDPHPSRAGVLDVREVLAVRPLPGFDHAPTRPNPSAECPDGSGQHDYGFADSCRVCGTDRARDTPVPTNDDPRTEDA